MMPTVSSEAVPHESAWQPGLVPPFPSVALKALNLMAGTETSLLELCNLIRTDVAFSAEVLRIANSPLVAFSKSVTSVVQASMLLGFRRLRSVVITVGLRTYLANTFTPLLRSCWRHSVACAIIAQRAAGWNSLDKDFAYTAGIMHDIGRMALAVSMPEAYARVVQREADKPGDPLETEREFCGIDHCQAGGALVEAWGLPSEFHEITSNHHSPEVQGRNVPSLVARSCALADALEFGAVLCPVPRSYPEIVGGFGEPASSRFPADGRVLATEISREIRLIESVPGTTGD